MNEPLIVGEEVLDYAVCLCGISQKLEEALELAENISSYSAWDAMRGEAKGEMELFAENLSAHISRLMRQNFYKV